MHELAGGQLAIGIDEVGRGALAGPLTVAAVALPDEPQIIGLDDSKKLTPKRREQLAQAIRAEALGYGIAHIAPAEIDACGMSASLRVAMARALRECERMLAARSVPLQEGAVLVDGRPVHISEREQALVGGDGRVACIAAASILAKVTRDAYMVEQAQRYPAYGLDANKGYGSSAHIEAIRSFGTTDLHRQTFLGKILSEQQTLL